MVGGPMRLCILALSSILVSTPVAAQPLVPKEDAPQTDAARRAWLSVNVHAAGWDLASVSSSGAFYLRRADAQPDGPQMPRVWIRQENFPGGGLWATGMHRSAIALDQFNCREGTSRMLQSTSYEYPDLSGSKVQDETTPTAAWTFVRPDSIESDFLARACPKGTPAR